MLLEPEAVRECCSPPEEKDDVESFDGSYHRQAHLCACLGRIGPSPGSRISFIRRELLHLYQCGNSYLGSSSGVEM